MAVRGPFDIRERTNLPLQLTSFVGRSAEIDELITLLSDARLVTLTGAGGIGKTRLALEVAARLLGDFDSGVWLVELASLTDPVLVPQAIAMALGFTAQPEFAPMEALIRVLGVRHLLCVLDNCEHLIEAAAQTADALLRHCPGLHILATSRDVLGVAGEVTWRVPSMPTPEKQRPHTLDELRGFEAVQLLLQRARAARPGYDLNDDNAPSVVRICQRVDGIPLAIELVAARVRSMSVPAIDERMADQFNLVSAGNRVSMARQRTLRATFDWSHALLTEAEKRVFRRLSVFAGGFTLDAAEAACSGGDAEGTNQSHLESITSLVDKSLVISLEGTREAGRYRLLEPIRQYAHERLSEVHEADAARGSHARFFLDLGDEAYRELRGPNQVAWMARVVSELDNFRACFDWSLEHAPPAALQLAVALERYWISNSAVEGLQLLEAALAASQAQDELHAHGLCRASNLATSLWQFDRARQFGDDCLALAQQLGSDLYVGLALSALASVGYQERREGWVAVSLSRLERAEPHVRLANDAEALARLLNNYGWFLYLAGDSLRARPKVEEALSLASGRDDTWMVTGVLDSLANIEFAAGNIERAEAHWKHAATLAGQLGLRASAADDLIGLARTAMRGKQPERCLRMLAAAKGLLSAAGASMETGQALEFVADKDAAWALLDRNKAELAWSEGAQMTLLSAVLYAVDYRMPGEPRVSASGSDGGENSPQNAKAFIREGEFWSLTYDGVVARLRDSKGLRDIARLLETPCREVAAVDLAGGELVDMARRSATVGELGLGVEGDVGEALDAEARSEYRARLFDLDEEIAGAERDNDPERASQAGEEREFLLSELGAAVGLGGRARRVLDPAERARKAVTGRIRDAIGHVETAHPALGRHLRRSIRTGSFCVYDPPEPIDWQL